MDFLDPEKKRSHLLRLFIGYILVAIAIAFAALILLFQSYGYDVDHRTGKVIQNGLLFVSARPDSAAVYLNGTLNKSRTDTKLTIPSGQYTVELKRDGYRTWKRSINLEGGSIERLVYPLLIPEKLKAADVQLYSSAPTFSTQSSDNRWLLVQQPGSLTNFDNFDLNNPNQLPTTLALTTDLLTAAADHKFSTIDWASDNKHALIRHDYTGGYEFVMIDREVAANSYNISKLLGATVNVTFLDLKSDRLTIYDPKALTLGNYDVKTKQLTPLLQKVTSFKAFGDKLILYSTDVGGVAGQINVRLWDGSISYLMQSFQAGTVIDLDIAQYSGDWYMAVSPRRDGHVYIYKNPQDTIKQTNPKALVPVSVLKIDQPMQLSFSEGRRFIAAQNGSKFAVYDIETDRRFYYELKQTIDVNQKAIWMDGYRMSLATDNKSLIFDYDGINQQELVAAVAGSIPYFNRDSTLLYNIAPSVVVPGRAALTRTELKL